MYDAHHQVTWGPSSMDGFLTEESEADLPDPWSAPEWTAGARVAFSSDPEALFSYADPPVPGEPGTVITIRTSMGDRTAYEGQVFVEWDRGFFLPVSHSHLTPISGQRVATNARRVAMGDLSDFMKVAGTDSDLVHKATRDLWSLKEIQGGYVIERLFDDTGKPLKV